VADLQKTVEIVFGGRNELSKTIGQVESSLDSLTGGTQVFADMADNVLRAETAVAALALAAAGLSIEQAGTFSDQFAEITTMIDANASELGGYRQEILDYANTSTQSLSDITGSVYSAISAGVKYTDALGVMSEAEQLAVAGKAPLKDSLVALASTMNAYGAATSEAGDYSDIFFTAVKQGQTTIPELAAAMSQATGVAAAAGVPFDDLSAAVAALTASGMPTSQAITSIKAALSNIIKPSSDAAKAAESLGIQFDTQALKTQGLSGFLQTLNTATGGNVETMGKLFGSVEGLNGVMVLSTDSSGKFADAMQAMENRAGATNEAYAKMVDNFELNNQKLVNNLQTVLVGIGTPLLDEYGDVVNALIANLQGIGGAINAGDLDGLLNIFEGVFSDIEALLTNMAQNLPQALANVDWSGLEASVGNLGGSLSEAFSAVFGDIDLSAVEQAVQRVVDLLSGLTNTTAGVIDGMNPLFTLLGELAENFADAGAEGQEFAGKILGIGKSINEIGGYLSTATDAIAGISSGLLMLGGSSVISSIDGLVTKIGGTAGLSAVLSGAGSAATALAGVLGPALLAGVLGTLAYKIGEFYGGMTESQRIMQETTAIAQQNAEAHGLVAQKLQEISTATGVNVSSMEQFNDLQKAGVLIYNDVTGEWEAAADAQEKLALMTANTSESMSKQQKDAHELDLQLTELTSKERVVEIKTQGQIEVAEIQAKTKEIEAALKLEGIREEEVTKRIEAMYDFNEKFVIEKTKRISDALNSSTSLVDSLSDSASSMVSSLVSDGATLPDKSNITAWIEDQLSKQSAAIDNQFRYIDNVLNENPVVFDIDTAMAIGSMDSLVETVDSSEKKVGEKTEKVKTALEIKDLNVQEMTKRIEAMYKFNSDSVVSEAQKITAAFESTSSSIAAVTGGMSSMVDSLVSDGATWEDKISISNWIDDQMLEQHKLNDAQLKLVDTQTQLARLKYEKLASGEALIKIDSSGLEPALEQVLWSIMEKVQLKVAMEEAELLLGLGTKVTP